jgi:5-methylcytosine-specific restriction endonuclease McrA
VGTLSASRDDWGRLFKFARQNPDEWRRLYRRYLDSPEWATRRIERLELAGGLCEDCDAQATHVHHLTYRRVGAERLHDLRALCANCHAIRHGHMCGRDATFADRVAAERTYGNGYR